MEEYRFERKEPLINRVVLALRIDTKQRKEQIWIGTDLNVDAALHGREKPLYLSRTRPLGSFWCEFGRTEKNWSDAVWSLSDALTAWRSSVITRKEQEAAAVLSQISDENAAAYYTAIQIWEMYLRCRRGRKKQEVAQALREYAQLLTLPFGEYTPEMFNWKREQPVVPVWNMRADAELEVWYPQGNVLFECAVAGRSLRPLLIYFRQRVTAAGMVMRTCTRCGRVFFAPDSRSSLCGERCRIASKKAARRRFSDRTKDSEEERAYAREYMFWYNHISKLKRSGAPQEQVDRAQAALKKFRAQAVTRKAQIKAGSLSPAQFTSWMISQEHIIREICGYL